jgi:RTX calcium-binding nonapeptide repeat (4 copies)
MSRTVKLILMGVLMLALAAGAALAQAAPLICPSGGGLCVGTPEADTISGSDNVEQIFALEGNDFVDGFGGNDLIYGNEDADTLRGAEQSDVVYGNTGNDSIDLVSFDTAGSKDQSFGGGGNDKILAQDGNVDSIDCGAGLLDQAFSDPGDTVTGCELVSTSSGAQADAMKSLSEETKAMGATR